MPPAFDTSAVSPSDAVVTLRSLRRRFGAVLTRAGLADGPGDPLHRRPPDGGLTPVGHAAWTAMALVAIDRALRQVLVESDPVVELPPVDDSPPMPPRADLSGADAAARIGDAAEALAGLMADVHGADWTRTAHSGDRPITALDMARLAVRISIEHLRAAERAIDQGFGPGADGNHHPR